MTPDPISLGLPGRVAAPLAYAGWWVTGVLFWFLERRDLFVRFHAAQACVVFGAIAIVVATLCGIAGASLAAHRGVRTAAGAALVGATGLGASEAVARAR